MATVSAKWHKVHEAEILQRSSHVVAVVNREAHIFGGELRPREPRDNDIHILSLGERTLYSHLLIIIDSRREKLI
jgi:hypothetical protein